MSRPETSLQQAVTSLSAATVNGEEHPTPEQLLAYQAGSLSEEAQEHLRDHIVQCTDCIRAVLDLAAWPDIAREPSLQRTPEKEARTPEEEAADWEAIQKRLVAAKEPDTKGSAFEAPTLIRSTPGRLLSFLRSLPRRSLSVGHLVVAPLLLVVIGLFFQVAHLKQQLEEVLGPRPNLFVMNLEPVDGAATRDAEEFTATTVPAGMENVVFLLVQEDFSPVDDHAVEIRDAVGQVFWQHRGMRSLPEGGFSLEVPLDSLASNLVEIRLYGLDGQDRKLSNPPRARSC